MEEFCSWPSRCFLSWHQSKPGLGEPEKPRIPPIRRLKKPIKTQELKRSGCGPVSSLKLSGEPAPGGPPWLCATRALEPSQNAAGNPGEAAERGTSGPPGRPPRPRLHRGEPGHARAHRGRRQEAPEAPPGQDAAPLARKARSRLRVNATWVRPNPGLVGNSPRRSGLWGGWDARVFGAAAALCSALLLRAESRGLEMTGLGCRRSDPRRRSVARAHPARAGGDS